MSIRLSGVLNTGIVVPRRVSLVLGRRLIVRRGLVRLLLVATLSAQTNEILRVIVSTAYQAQSLWHHGMNLRGGSLIDLRFDGETWRHAGYWFLMRLKVSVILSLSNGYGGAKIRCR